MRCSPKRALHGRGISSIQRRRFHPLRFHRDTQAVRLHPSHLPVRLAGGNCHQRAAEEVPATFYTYKSWRTHVRLHLDENLVDLQTHIPERAVFAGWRFCTTCSEPRTPGLTGALKDGRESRLRLAFRPGSPCRPGADSSSSPSVAEETRLAGSYQVSRAPSRHQEHRFR